MIINHEECAGHLGAFIPTFLSPIACQHALLYAFDAFELEFGAPLRCCLPQLAEHFDACVMLRSVKDIVERGETL